LTGFSGVGAYCYRSKNSREKKNGRFTAFKSTPAHFTVVTNHGGGSPTKKGKSEIDRLVENKTM